jgi:hypothetical protein
MKKKIGIALVLITLIGGFIGNVINIGFWWTVGSWIALIAWMALIGWLFGSDKPKV